jgi:hypothetical protein
MTGMSIQARKYHAASAGAAARGGTYSSSAGGIGGGEAITASFARAYSSSVSSPEACNFRSFSSSSAMDMIVSARVW